MMGECFLCGRYGAVERHHCLGGGNRKKSDQLGLVVLLCPDCHREGRNAAHRCRETAEYLKRYAQKKAMSEQKWDTQKFIEEFGRNYL